MSWPGSGTVSEIPAVTILRLARTIRWASVVSLARNARAIWGVVRPTTARRVSASRASGASAGWQHAKSSASRSSVPRVAGSGLLGSGGSRGEVALPPGPAYGVERVAVGGGLQPGCRVVGRTVAAPGRQGLHDRLLDRLLGEVEVAEAAGQPGHQQTGLLAQGTREEPVADDLGHEAGQPSMCE